jgi:enamine deaminase RidA (YjgF/YER057c/UK114 family)
MPKLADSGLTQSTTTDDVSRRHLVTGAAVVAALGATTPEALAQGAPAAARAANLRFIKPATSFNNPGFTHAVEAMGPGRLIYIAGQQGLDINGKVVGAPGDFMAQAEQAFLNIKGILG